MTSCCARERSSRRDNTFSMATMSAARRRGRGRRGGCRRRWSSSRCWSWAPNSSCSPTLGQACRLVGSVSTVTKPKDRAAARTDETSARAESDRAVIRRWCSHRRRRWNHRVIGRRRVSEKDRRRPSRRGRPSGEPASAEWPAEPVVCVAELGEFGIVRPGSKAFTRIWYRARLTRARRGRAEPSCWCRSLVAGGAVNRRGRRGRHKGSTFLCSTRRFAAARKRRNTPSRLVVTRRHSSSETSETAPPPPTPALANTESIRPPASSTDATKPVSTAAPSDAPTTSA